MTKPIVVAVSEGDEAREAVALGATAARLMDAPLVLAGIAVTQAPGGATVVPGWAPATDAQPLRDYVAGELHRRAEEVPDDVPCTIHVAAATGVLPGLEIVLEKEDAQLLVVGASHLGPLARALRGDIGAGAVRHAGCAVLAVPASDGDVVAPPRRIGIAWDGDQESDAALEVGAALAARADGSLRVLRAADAGRREEARAALDEVVERLGSEVPCEGRLIDGPASGGLVAATGDLDLLLLGAHNRSAMATAWLGSVSATVLRHARCPVLIMPHGARVSVPS